MPASQSSARAGTPLGQRYAALCTACSIAERVRDAGGHALVVLDDISCMVRWHQCLLVCGRLYPLGSQFGVNVRALNANATPGST